MDKRIESLIGNIEKVVIGKTETVTFAVAALLMEGHVLIEDVPGVGKTQLAAALSKSVEGEFSRIQLTPDIMPSDITGFTMIDRQTGKFEYKKGAAFCNFLLADEINRASPKAQSALLEIMEEHQVSLDGKTYELPSPFMVLATQNPVETYGTYHLPEAQMDRFSMKISMGYPDKSQEADILGRNEHANPISSINAVLTTKDILEMQAEVKKVRAADNVKDYIVSITDATRSNDAVKLGVSPRGSIALYKASKAWAFINGRDYVTPEDVRRCAVRVLAHRLMISPKGKAEYGSAEKIIEAILSGVSVPKE